MGPYMRDLFVRYTTAVKSCYDWTIQYFFEPCFNLTVKICQKIKNSCQHVITEFIRPCYAKLLSKLSKIFESIKNIAEKVRNIVDKCLTVIFQKVLEPFIENFKKFSKWTTEKLVAPAYSMIEKCVDVLKKMSNLASEKIITPANNMIDKLYQAILKFNTQINTKLFGPVLKSYGEVIKSMNKLTQRFF